MERIKGLRELIDGKLLRFLLVGSFNTALSLVMMFGFYRVLGLGYWGSSALAYFLCSIVSYFLNRSYTFRSSAGMMRSVLRFAVNIGVCYCVAYLLAKPMVRFGLGLTGGLFSATFLDQLAMLAGMALFTGMNYLGQRLYVFPDTKTTGQEKEDESAEGSVEP